jgi:hypothetical protein
MGVKPWRIGYLRQPLATLTKIKSVDRAECHIVVDMSTIAMGMAGHASVAAMERTAIAESGIRCGVSTHAA